MKAYAISKIFELYELKKDNLACRKFDRIFESNYDTDEMYEAEYDYIQDSMKLYENVVRQLSVLDNKTINVSFDSMIDKEMHKIFEDYDNKKMALFLTKSLHEVKTKKDFNTQLNIDYDYVTNSMILCEETIQKIYNYLNTCKA